MSKQTAVEWLVEQIIAPYANIEKKETLFVLTPTMSKELFEKAKEKELSQIADASMHSLERSIHYFLDYEIRSSWWASWIGWNWLQELSGKYFAWKVRRKYARYEQSKMWQQRISRW
jgi:hypothetical protein